MKKVRKGGFQLMLILGLLRMYFDAAVVFVTSHTLLFRLALAILWEGQWRGIIMGVTRLLLLGPFYTIQTNFMYFFAQDCK